MDHFCKYHSERKTNKKCYYCKGYICTECQRPFFSTVFCSTSCLLLALLQEARLWIKKEPKRRGRQPTKRTANLRFFPWLLHVAYVLFFIFIYQQFRDLRQEMRDLRETMTAPLTVKHDTVFIKVPEPKIEPPPLIKPEKAISEEGGTAPETIELRPPLPAIDFSRGNVNERVMALTFDGGSGDGAAATILDYLREKNVRCTFFLTGHFIRKFPDVVRRIVAEGHEVGNHTWSHPHLTTFEKNGRHDTLPKITREKIHEELNKTAALFKEVTGQEMAKLWRAPYGEHNAQIRSWAAELGYTHVGWTLGRGETLDTFDWVADPDHKLYKPSQQIMQKILHFGANRPERANGGIILMHLDSQRKNDPAHAIVPALIDSIRHRGYQLVTVSKMVGG